MGRCDMHICVVVNQGALTFAGAYPAVALRTLDPDPCLLQPQRQSAVQNLQLTLKRKLETATGALRCGPQPLRLRTNDSEGRLGVFLAAWRSPCLS